MRALWIGGVFSLIALSAIGVSCAVLPHPPNPPDSSSTPISSSTAASVELNNRTTSSLNISQNDPEKKQERHDKATNSPAIGESIKMVANQLLQGNKTPPPTSNQGGVVEDTRTPPKMKNQQVNKNKTSKPVNDKTKIEPVENSHAGIAIPVSPEDIEKEFQKPNTTGIKKNNNKETSTPPEGISTWILLNGNPTTIVPKPTDMKTENKSGDPTSKDKKPAQNIKPKPKPNRAPPPSIIVKPIFTRKPVAIASSNKSDLIASGSAVNENVMNKIKASVLANVQKNKNAALNKTTTPDLSETTPVINKMKIDSPTDIVFTSNIISPNITFVKVEQNSENKNEVSNAQDQKEPPIIQFEDGSNNIGIESKQAEIELEVSTPSSSTKNKKKTSSKRKKNKNRRRKPTTSNKVDENVKESKINQKNNTKVATKTPPKEKPITTQIYNYLSREVMPSVGVGLVSLAGLVGLASYFLYPFSNVVRRAYNPNDRKDDIYHQNGEQYADEGGQREEEILGALFPDVPPESNNKLQNINPYAAQTQFTYPKPSHEQNIRYKNSFSNSDRNAYVPNNRIGQKEHDVIQGSTYSEQIQYDTHTPNQRDKFIVYPQPQPIYKSPDRQIEDSIYTSDASYGNDEPIYGQAMRYSQEINLDPTKLSSNANLDLSRDDVIEQQKETGYTIDAMSMDDKEPQFVVGNIPKEMIQAVTPVSVPEHGPRSLRIRKRSIEQKQKEPKITSAAESLRKILDSPEHRENDFSNEIDDELAMPYMKSSFSNKGNIMMTSYNEPVNKSDVEFASSEEKYPTTQTDIPKEAETTTKQFIEESVETSTANKKEKIPEATTVKSVTTSTDCNETQPPNQAHQPFSFLNFVRSLIDFKLRLGINLLQTTSDNISRYLNHIENSLNNTTPSPPVIKYSFRQQFY